MDRASAKLLLLLSLGSYLGCWLFSCYFFHSCFFYRLCRHSITAFPRIDLKIPRGKMFLLDTGFFRMLSLSHLSKPLHG